MFDPAIFPTIVQGLDAAKKALDLIRDAKGPSDKKAIAHAIVEVQSQLLDAKDKILTLRGQLQEVQEQNMELKQQLKAKADWTGVRKLLVHDNGKGVYRMPVPPDGYDEGPYCIRCADCDNNLVHAIPAGKVEHAMGRWYECPQCSVGQKRK